MRRFIENHWRVRVGSLAFLGNMAPKFLESREKSADSKGQGAERAPGRGGGSNHLGAGRDAVDSRAVTDGLFAVHVCKAHKAPATAYVAIFHRGYWFYIDDRDQASKGTFALVLATSRLDFARQHPTAGPLLTLPVGR
jgi:hypothetical protein